MFSDFSKEAIITKYGQYVHSSSNLKKLLFDRSTSSSWMELYKWGNVNLEIISLETMKATFIAITIMSLVLVGKATNSA